MLVWCSVRLLLIRCSVHLILATSNSTQSFQAVGCIAVVGTGSCVSFVAHPVPSTVVDTLCMLRQFRKARDHMGVFNDFPAHTCIRIPILVIIWVVRIHEL